MRIGEQDSAPIIDRLLEVFAEDHRPGRPGPSPPRLKADVRWEDLIRVLVTTPVWPEATQGEMNGVPNPRLDSAPTDE